MTRSSSEDRTNCDEGGLSSFLRSLLSGIPWSERASDEELIELPLQADLAVDLHNANGKTRVIGEDRENISIRAIKHARAESEEAAQQLLHDIQLRTEVVGSTLELDVEIPRRWNRHGSMDLEVKVPRHIQLRVSSANGKLCLQGLRRGVHAHSGNGSVRLNDVVGDIDITTANAKVSCSCTCGRLVARSSNGKIEVAEHSGSIDACTSNGLIHASLERLTEEGITLATSNGRIVLELPSRPDAEVDIRVENGVIHSDLELGHEIREANGRLRGRLGRGGTPIKLRTSNGTISLR